MSIGTPYVPNSDLQCVLCEAKPREGRRPHCHDCGLANFIYRRYGTGQNEAQKKVKEEVRKGRMPPPDYFECADCEKQASVYEHRDYNFPLEVVPVCKGCNAKRGYAIPKKMTFEEFLDSVKGTHFFKGQWPIKAEIFEPIRRMYWEASAEDVSKTLTVREKHLIDFAVASMRAEMDEMADRIWRLELLAEHFLNDKEK